MALLIWSGTHGAVEPPKYGTMRVWVGIQSGSWCDCGRLGVGEAAGAEHGDEQLNAPPRPRTAVE